MDQVAKKLGPIESIDLIHRIEDETPVCEWKIDGVHIWPFVRIEIATRLRSLNYVGKIESEPTMEFSRSALRKALRADRGNAACLFSRRTVLAFGTATGKTKTGDGFYNQYMAPVCKWFSESGYPSLLIERDKYGRGQLPRGSPSFWLSYRAIRPVTNFLRKLFRHLPSAEYLPGLDQVRDMVERYIVDPDLLSIQRMKARFSDIKAFKFVLSTLLSVARPAVVVVQCFYAFDSMALAWACRQKGIVCLDYQHGVQGAYHYAYAEWRRIPSDGYSLLPDGFLTWDAETSASLRTWTKDRFEVFTIGNLWHDTSEVFVSQFGADLARLLEAASGRVIVLFTVQDFVPAPWILKAMAEIPGFFWCVRLHPLHQSLRSKIEDGIGDTDNYEISVSTAIPLPLLMDIIGLHVTGNSSVVNEANAYGIKSIVMDQIGLHYYGKLIDAGKVFHAANRPELESILANCPRWQKIADAKRAYPERQSCLTFVDRQKATHHVIGR